MVNERLNEYIEKYSMVTEEVSKIDSSLYLKYDVKKGLRNSDGTGVLVGLTKIGEVHGYVLDEKEKMPVEGRLSYRGIKLDEFVEGFQKDGRFGFEECCYLILFGKLPTKSELQEFTEILSEIRFLPGNFIEDMILKAPSPNIMNKLARSVLALYSYDENPEDNSIKNVLRQSMELIARFPVLAAYGYQAKAHYFDGGSLFIHQPQKDLSIAENFLHLIRSDSKYSRTEAELLDLMLVVHAEHGGGNNSAYTTRVVTSSGTDTYSVIAAAIGSLKGYKHGGANLKVSGMMQELKETISNWKDEGQIKDYLVKVIRKQAYDRTGLVYGLGHAIYTLSDPRAVVLKRKAIDLAEEKGRMDEMELYMKVEELGPKLLQEVRGLEKVVCANVDFYSGFVYDMMNIPKELYTPLFAVSRVVGWCTHRIEELVNVQKITRPAFKAISRIGEYKTLDQRG